MSGTLWHRQTAVVFSFLLTCGCASTQLNYNAVEVASTIGDVYMRQTLNNLSKFIDDPYAIPSHVVIGAGTIQTINTVNPSIGFPLAGQIARTATAAPAGLTLANANTLAGVGATFGATNAAQQNYNIAPLNDANTLRNQQALYRHAVFGTPLKGNYRPPRLFFQN